MKSMARLCLGMLVVSSLTANVTAAMADEKAKGADGEKGLATRTVLAESEKVQAFEIRQKPGEVNNANTSGTRVIRALQGGTLLRTYADGRTEESIWKTGEVQIQESGPQYSIKNIGNTEVILYVVRLK